MSSPSNLTLHDPSNPPPHATGPVGEPRPFYWSIRRELWENRSIYLAPFIVAAVVLFASAIGTMTAAQRTRHAPANVPAKPHSSVSSPVRMAPAPIMLASFLVGFFYCLDTLYGERRERSILFWKSLPVSDRTTVLSKATIPLAVLPAIAFALSVVTQILILQLGSLFMLGSGDSPSRLWAEARFFSGLVIMLYGLIVHALWFAPIYAWLLLVSAWAKRAPVLWALLPILGISALERMAFNTWHFMHMLQYRVTGAMLEGFAHKPKGGGGGDFSRLSQLDPVKFLGAPGLWVGLLFTVMFLAAAVRLRRSREPI